MITWQDKIREKDRIIKAWIKTAKYFATIPVVGKNTPLDELVGAVFNDIMKETEDLDSYHEKL